MNLKKRSKAEVDKSVDVDRDYTGGYEYLPWLIYMRGFGYCLPMLGLFAVGIYCFTQPSPAPWFGIGAIAASGLIKFMLRRDYKLLKKGISS